MINYIFLNDVEKKWFGDMDWKRRMFMVEEGNEKFINMVYLCIVGFYVVNGVV